MNNYSNPTVSIDSNILCVDITITPVVPVKYINIWPLSDSDQETQVPAIVEQNSMLDELYNTFNKNGMFKEYADEACLNSIINQQVENQKALMMYEQRIIEKLSASIADEIDQEVLNELLKQANGKN